MLFSFSEEDSVLNLHDRIAARVGVSANQFVLVVQDRTLVSARRLCGYCCAAGPLSTCKGY